MSEFTTLYYPWAAIERPDTLKKALVFFDRVLVVCERNVVGALQSSIASYPTQYNDVAKEAIANLSAFVEETLPLQEKEHLVLVSPEEAMRPDDARSLVYASVIDDLRDEELVRSRPPFSVFGDDSFLIDIGDFGSMAMLNYFLVDFYAAHHSIGSKYLTGYDPTFRFHQNVHYGVPDRVRELYSPLIDRQGHLGVAHFVQAFAVAQALYLASKHGASLFTDDPGMGSYLRRKYSRAVTNAEVAERLNLRKLQRSAKAGLLAHRVLEPLPDLSLESYDDVIEIRESAPDEFSRFRLEIAKLAATIRSAEYGADLFDEVDNTIAHDVNPAIAELRRKLDQSKSRIIQRIWKRGIGGTAGIPFAVGLFSGLPPALCLLASAVVVGVDIAIDTYLERKEIRGSNAFAFLFNAALQGGDGEPRS
jgi:hypothetical protein